MSAAARFSALFPAPASANAAAAPSVLLRAGEALGVWRISAPLQPCESGRWYSVEHSLAAQTAAVLVYQRPGEAMAVLLRLAEQAGAAAAQADPLFVNALDSGVTADGLPYIVLPGPAGLPLMSASAELPLRQRLQLVLQLCDALQSLREHGLLLRELDPGLLWLAPGPQLRLMNLGLADLADEPRGMPQPYGTAAQPFQSPELQAGALPSLASEAYAVGMLCCWLANGRPLRQQDGALLQSINSTAGLTAAERVSLEAVLHKAVAPTTVLRYPSVRELAEDLRAWLAGESHSALRLTPMPALAAHVAANDAAVAERLFVPAFDGSADQPPAQAGLLRRVGQALQRLIR